MLNAKIEKMELDGFSLNNIDFTLKKGEVLALIGLNGSGKTTLLKSIAGIHEDHEIKISYNGEKLSANHIEYIPPFLSPQLSLKSRFFLEASLDKLFISKEDKARISKICKLLKISDLLEKNLKHLSSGEMVKLLLARVLLKKKPVILWDEPSSFLDLKYKIFLKKVLDKIKKNHIIIITTHDFRWINSICDHYLALRNGTQCFFETKPSKQQFKKVLL